MLAAEQALELQAAEDYLDPIDSLARLLAGVRILLGQLEVYLRVLQDSLLLSPGLQRPAYGRSIAEKGLRLFSILPEVGCGCLLVEFLDSPFAVRYVKDASRTRPTALRCVSRVL